MQLVPTTGKLAVWGSGVVLLAGLVLLLALGNWSNPQPTTAPLSRHPAVANPTVRFTDVTDQAGIHFTHHNGYSGKKLLPETMGSGVAVIDFDNDGYPDLLFINSCPWPGQEKPGEPLPTLMLYRNLGDGTFQDVTAEAGLNVTIYGMGVTVGDYDNDGFPDVFITGVGGNKLFHNEADAGRANGRRFKDVTADARVGGPSEWQAASRRRDFFAYDQPLTYSTSAAWLDYDGDGLLDLFVCNYVRWVPAEDLHASFTRDGKERTFGPPTAFEGTQCFLYHNLGNGKFEDVSAKAGIQVFEKGESVGKALGVVVCDLDEDGWPDIVVANDSVRNFCFHNVAGPDGTRVFEEIGIRSGVGYAEAKARGAMGVDWGIDVRPGENALLIGNFANEPNTYLRPSHPRKLQFIDTARKEGVDGPTRRPMKFGLFFFDYDLDGRLDFLTCNGHLEPDIAKTQHGETYEQSAQLFWNAGKDGFQEVDAADAGPDLFRPLVGRGCAYLSINRKGPLDVVLTANGGKARLLHNEGGNGNHWLRLKLEGDGVRSNRSAIGAQVTVEAGGLVQHREVTSARGYLSQSELVLTFGLGKATKVDRVTIQWPGKNAGEKQVISGLAIDREHTIQQEGAR
jgi:enediyne biosynthesis protein E4